LRLISGAVKSRFTRSGGRQRPFPGRVAPLRFRFFLATRFCPAVSTATEFSLTFQPASLRSAVILGDPYVP
jgi:hypothetical protein